ncbi:MAG TPA: hypothetical protein VKQ07_04940, partial [Jatrophihabitantaceae bacterium]|nr:hypothetical protein [Jatrophihabitantaceae bacterium]
GRTLVTRHVDIKHADVAAAEGTIWLTGDTPQGAVVRTLDPGTLQPGPELDIATVLGRSAEIAAIGSGSIWLDDAYDSSGRIWCVDAAAGPVGPSWATADQVASGTGSAFLFDSTSVRTLPLVAECAG